MLARVRTNLSLGDLAQAALMRVADPVEALERAFAKRFGFPHGLVFPYGRSALHALVTAGGWQGREVLSPAYICAEVPFAVTAAGARVRLVDSADEHFLPGDAEWDAAASPSAAMAVVTPLFGYPVDKRCEALLRQRSPGIFLLYDESQSYGVEDAEGMQMRDADGALFSLGLGKMATGLGGGVLLLRDGNVHDAVKQARDASCRQPTLVRTAMLALKGLIAWTAFREPALSLLDFLAHRLRVLALDAQDWTPTGDPGLPGDAAVMPSSYEARIGLRQLARLDAFVAARRRIGEHYERRLRAAGLHTFGHPPQGPLPLWPRYPWPTPERERTVAALRQHGIQISLFLPYSCADLPAYREQAAVCPNARLWGRSMINLPNWLGMRISQADRVLAALLELRDRHPQAASWPALTTAVTETT
jgi:dTDP-4-amino-4,6-dideoxygalactose transaminase